jgi:hypothetical protein
MVIHLGINPVNGGIPPSDRSIRGNASFIIGIFDSILFRLISVDTEYQLNIIKMGIIIIE